MQGLDMDDGDDAVSLRETVEDKLRHQTALPAPSAMTSGSMVQNLALALPLSVYLTWLLLAWTDQVVMMAIMMAFVLVAFKIVREGTEALLAAADLGQSPMRPFVLLVLDVGIYACFATTVTLLLDRGREIFGSMPAGVGLSLAMVGATGAMVLVCVGQLAGVFLVVAPC